jgi:hypothetical protein
LRIDVNDRFLDIDDQTYVTVSLGFSPLTDLATHRSYGPNGPFVPVPELPGNAYVLAGPWGQVARQIWEITPAHVGYYLLAVEAYVNIVAGCPGPAVMKAITYVSPVVRVEAL